MVIECCIYCDNKRYKYEEYWEKIRKIKNEMITFDIIRDMYICDICIIKMNNNIER